MKYLALLLLLVTSNLYASVPLAPRMGANGKMDMFGCMQSNDYYIINFAAYQQTEQQKKDKTPPVPQCLDLVYLGKTQIAIDLLDRDVRQKKSWLKIFDNHHKLIAETQPTVAKQAVLGTTVDFSHQGQYDVVLYVEDTDLNSNPETTALHIPLTVAMTIAGEPATAVDFSKIIIAIIILALILVFLITKQLKPKTI